jgi:cytochrome c oxidase subunit IV
MAGLYVRLLACLVMGVPAGLLVYRWLHLAFEGRASVQATVIALLALGALVLVMRLAARSLARAP